jgi:flotillin
MLFTAFVWLLVATIALIIILLLKASYTVVPAHEAHVVISRSKGRRFYCSREGFKSSYWKLPIIQKRHVIPIENVKIYVDDIPLRDRAMAKFSGDVIAWINITDPLKAAERFGLLKEGVNTVITEVKDIVRSVARNMSMYWTIIDIMTKRKDFSEDVMQAINKELGNWGGEIVELEVIHFKDIEGYTVVKDLEQRQATVINAETRKKVATENKNASIVESNAEKDTKTIQAQNMEEYRKRELQRDEEVGKREQQKEMNVQEARKKAQQKKVEAERAYTVGKAEYEAEATVTQAEGKRDARKAEGVGEAEFTRQTGTAQADVIQKKGEAEAVAVEKKALAQKKYETSQALAVELFGRVVDGYVDIQKSMWENTGQALQKADVRVISTGEEGEIFGIPIGAKAGVALGGMFESLKESTGLDIAEVVKDVVKGTKEVAQGVLGKGKGGKDEQRAKSD